MVPETENGKTLVLDEEFKAGLVAIRPLIRKLCSNEDIQSFRLWLERLHGALDERKCRNFLLNELISQLKYGQLAYPFNEPPPEGSLSIFKLYQIDSPVNAVNEKTRKDLSKIEQKDGNQFKLEFTSKFIDKVNGLRKSVHNVEKVNKRILAAFEKKLNHYKKDCDFKVQCLRKEIEYKDRLINNLQTALKTAESKRKAEHFNTRCPGSTEK